MNYNQVQRRDNEICAICLATAAARGGEFLCSPGCCGKWFHQSCIDDMKKAGKNFCPACMKPFPTLPPPQTAPVVQVPVQIQLNQAPQSVSNAPPPTGIFSRLFSRQSSNRTAAMSSTSGLATNNMLEEDPVEGEKSLKESSKDTAANPKNNGGTETVEDQLSVTLTSEYDQETLDEKYPFFVRVSALFNNSAIEEEKKTPLDVVCVLDNSGSMAGSKIENLKRAMEFVISTLREKDRLSVVTFNSSATPIQGLWKMNNARKEASRGLVRAIEAGGGTDIYRGMLEGREMLSRRTTKNPASCMFLLTDGQDSSNLEEKKALAKAMREQGTALFVFGFGNDHDSAQLTAIANAAEGSFIYVETNDTVIDAFGGAIGSQQGQLLRDIHLTIHAQAGNVVIEDILSGSYVKSLSADKREGSVQFADLYGGEKRDFLLKMRLPAIAAPEEVYSLIAVQARFKLYGIEDLLTTSSKTCSIHRMTKEAYLSSPVPHERDGEVDAQIQRLDLTSVMQDAMKEADRANFKEAKAILQRMKTQILESVSYKQKNPLATGLLHDLNEMEAKIGSREVYEGSGGRALLSETANMYSRQRAVYSKNSNAVQWQSVASNVCQESARNYKMSKK